MKLAVIIIILLAILTVVLGARRPYTTPSPYGSYRLKQVKCSCNDKLYEYVYPNWTCFAKALSRDVTTGNAYGMLKRDVDKVWLSTNIEYKYGTIYRSIMTLRKREGCELLGSILDAGGPGSNPLIKTLYKFAEIVIKQYGFEHLIHKCPFKAGEFLSAYNITFDPKHIPSVFNQGDYRGTMYVYADEAENLICNNSLILSFTSPIKDSFGKK